MKVILLQDVARIGKRHSEVSVPDGYALNQLIPKKMAVPATPAQRQLIARAMAGKAATSLAAGQSFAATIEQLNTNPIVLRATANEQGHLFQAVHATDVVTAAAALGLSLESDWVVLPAEPIKTVGDHEITLRCGADSRLCRLQVTAA